ncbi:MAG: ABC transporter substrate-binding protein [Candidimonas sp.]|nr:MAG: ABC transporter substrate-binding protein [Candidimonas sp.]
MNSRRFLLGLGVAVSLSLGLAGGAQAELAVNPNGPPNDFVRAVGDNALNAIKQAHVGSGEIGKINQIVDKYVLPYVDMRKTTRLSAGRYWRQATPQQQTELVNAFKGTLIRTYSGAFTRVDLNSKLTFLPFRGNPESDDVAVRSTLTLTDSPSIGIDYRLEKTPQGWKIYDLNVEGIWLIQNYRNQFAEQISRNGIDGLIQALNAQSRRQQ